MSKMKYYVFTVIILIFVFFVYQKLNTKNLTTNTKAESHAPETFYTCPMHPQVHQDHPGNCPICHMKLVKIEKKSDAVNAMLKIDSKTNVEKKSDIKFTASVEQLKLVNINKIQVEKMNLESNIFISGRFIDSNYLTFQVYESDLRYLKIGTGFSGRSNIYQEDLIYGKIYSIDRLVDPTSRTVRVVGRIENGDSRYLPESTFSGEIKIEMKNSISIPESAVMHTGKGDFVYKIIDDNNGNQSLVMKKIIIGLKSQSYYQVLDGLDEGEIISSGPNFLLDSEAKIKGIGVNDHSNH